MKFNGHTYKPIVGNDMSINFPTTDAYLPFFSFELEYVIDYNRSVRDCK